MTHDLSPVYLFDLWLTNDTVCTVCFLFSPHRRRNKNEQVLQGESKKKKKTSNEKKWKVDEERFLSASFFFCHSHAGFPSPKKATFSLLLEGYLHSSSESEDN